MKKPGMEQITCQLFNRGSGVLPESSAGEICRYRRVVPIALENHPGETNEIGCDSLPGGDEVLGHQRARGRRAMSVMIVFAPELPP